MIFMCTAMYCEAEPFIKQLNLKKDFESHKFEIFKNDEITLIITGIGKIKAAVAVTYLFSKYNTKNSDLFINIGVCGAKNEDMAIGTVFLCNKIIENDTKKTFYTEMIFRHSFEEASIETCSLVINNEETKLDGSLIDMEASAIYEAALVFLKTHQIFFIKVASDNLKSDRFSNDSISKLIESKSFEIINWINGVKKVLSYEDSVISEKEKIVIDSIVGNLKLSSTMGSQLKQYLTYYKLQYGNFMNLINMYIDVECKSKNEGKRYFAELKHKLA